MLYRMERIGRVTDMIGDIKDLSWLISVSTLTYSDVRMGIFL